MNHMNVHYDLHFHRLGQNIGEILELWWLLITMLAIVNYPWIPYQECPYNHNPSILLNRMTDY